MFGAYSSISDSTRLPKGSRSSSHVASRRVYGAYCRKIPMMCLPGGASDGSYIVGTVNSSKGRSEGRPYLASSQARSTYSMLGQMCMVALWCGPGVCGQAVNSGSPESARLIFDDV